LGVTINASGINISGVATAGIVSATTLYGNGANITGIGLSIAPLNYNPAVLGSGLAQTVGIGLTFNQGVKAGSGNVTLRIAGAAGTVVENFGVGNSVTYGYSDYGTTVTIDPTNNLNSGETYHISYPSGAFTNIGGDVSYVGTAYTFGVLPYFGTLWTWGDNEFGWLGHNTEGVKLSSPTQIPGTNWKSMSGGWSSKIGTKNDGTLWAWGRNNAGQLGQNNKTNYSSPVQIGSDTTWSTSIDDIANTSAAGGAASSAVIKTDGTLWAWGENDKGQLGQNSVVALSSPIQIPGTTWKNVSANGYAFYATKTNGTLWSWGSGTYGSLGHNQGVPARYSSPTQIGSDTTWDLVYANDEHTAMAIKTDGTAWTWGSNERGHLGLNTNGDDRSSPAQLPGTTWSKGQYGTSRVARGATKTDGTLWMWGQNTSGQLGVNDEVRYSSPIQVGTDTTWSSVSLSYQRSLAVKTDGTLWTWGANDEGQLGLNNTTKYSSPVQIPGTDWSLVNGSTLSSAAIQTP